MEPRTWLSGDVQFVISMTDSVMRFFVQNCYISKTNLSKKVLMFQLICINTCYLCPCLQKHVFSIQLQFQYLLIHSLCFNLLAFTLVIYSQHLCKNICCLYQSNFVLLEHLLAFTMFAFTLIIKTYYVK